MQREQELGVIGAWWEGWNAGLVEKRHGRVGESEDGGMRGSCGGVGLSCIALEHVV